MTNNQLALVNILMSAINLACGIMTGIVYSYLVALFCAIVGLTLLIIPSKNK